MGNGASGAEGGIGTSAAVRWGTWLALLLILGYGLHLRAHHLDYPSIGYHNAKENEYLSQVLLYEEQGLSFRHQAHFWEGNQETPYFEGYFQLQFVPLVSWAARRVLGEHYWATRLPVVLLSLGVVLLAHALARRLADPWTALLVAALVAVLPVHVFFGRNLQPDVPALFFLLGFYLLFLRWTDRPTPGAAAAAGLSLAMAGLCKLSFLVPALAILPWVPWRKLADDLRALRLAPYLGFASFLVCPAFIAWLMSRRVLEVQYGTVYLHNVQTDPMTRISPFRFLTPDYWSRYGPSLRAYVVDNYTTLFALLAVAGLVCLFSRRTSREMRGFLWGSLGALVVYWMLFADFLNQHSYYQLPFLFLVALLVAAGLAGAAGWLAERTGRPALRVLAFVPVLANLGAVDASLDRHFGTQVVGIDVAGRFIDERAAADERFMFMGAHQHVGVCTFARRFCVGVPRDPADLHAFEERFGSRFIYVAYEYLPALQQKPSWESIAARYAVRQVAVLQRQRGRRTVHYVLERGAPYEPPAMGRLEFEPAARYELLDETAELRVATP